MLEMHIHYPGNSLWNAKFPTKDSTSCSLPLKFPMEWANLQTSFLWNFIGKLLSYMYVFSDHKIAGPQISGTKIWAIIVMKLAYFTFQLLCDGFTDCHVHVCQVFMMKREQHCTIPSQTSRKCLSNPMRTWPCTGFWILDIVSLWMFQMSRWEC